METEHNFKVAEVELSYKSKVKPQDRPVINYSSDAYKIFQSVWSDKIELVEECYLLALNRANKVIAFSHISTGNNAATFISAKIVFTTALKLNANSFIIAHNHPSGSLIPSDDDLILTIKLVEIGKLLGMPIIDHLIITRDGYYSFLDDGELNY